ncbi:hypothetical protein LOK49_LG02G00150 [Camellia lanceoleosa]|uniref:Uncharacterized protein n=1 Tax=Camellia lanceoleosa TaxID=1840588 RepID=A0ACC0IN11_9ERIC|nr:hypothetical protein LOK49_LG02G00150 [Camellia lanceoleosa]
MDPHSQTMDSEDEVEEPSATPLWKYVTKVPGETSSAKPGEGGSMKFICNFGCKTEAYTGSYSRSIIFVLLLSTNCRSLTRYRDEDFNNWDAYPEDTNIEEDFTIIEQRDNVSLSDSEEDVENNFDDIGVPSLALTVTASPSCPPPTIQESSSMEKIERAQRRLEKARGKKQKK